VGGFAAHLGRQKATGDEGGLAQAAFELRHLATPQRIVILRVAEMAAVI